MNNHNNQDDLNFFDVTSVVTTTPKSQLVSGGTLVVPKKENGSLQQTYSGIMVDSERRTYL